MKISVPLKTVILLLICGIPLLSSGQEKVQRQDTVIIELARSSRVIFLMRDRNDIQILRNYNFQQMFQDILTKIEKRDTTRLATTTTTSGTSDSTQSGAYNNSWTSGGDEREEGEGEGEYEDEDEWNDNHSVKVHFGRSGKRRTHQSFNVDLGMNNFLVDGNIPTYDIYAVRPWGSWYVAATSIQRSMIARNFYLEWGLGMSFYNFKFEKDNLLVTKSDTEIQFQEDTRDLDFIKSKLSATYLNVSIVPVLDFGRRQSKTRIWDSYGSSFRIGFGGYAGYRVGSHTKNVYDDGNRERSKNRDNFYLNSLRYGLRAQVGIRSTDFFFNYDLNELFAEGKGPKLNAVSFGVIF